MRALLVGCRVRGEDKDVVAESVAELARLLDTAGGVEVGRLIVEVKRPVPATFVGSGSLGRIKTQLDDLETPVRCVVFDIDLSPGQQRNVEAVLDVMVMDRTGLILDIFARRARSSEGRLQVELAQYQYLLPRLRGMWAHLSRQGAGIGTRGPGETDLEVDRRRIRLRIDNIKRRLKKVRVTRELHRRERRKNSILTVALVGYTNAGKSTLLNRMTDADVRVEDRLFATLDPTVREVRLPGNVRAVLIDTVGFIQRLPHQLVESFKATLEEVQQADLLIHVIDASHPRLDDQAKAVLLVLDEIGVADQPILNVFNKADRVVSAVWLKRLVENHEPAVAISAQTGENLDELCNQLARLLASQRRCVTLRIPQSRPDLLHRVRTGGEVLDETFADDAVIVVARLDDRLAGQLKPYRVEEESSCGD